MAGGGKELKRKLSAPEPVSPPPLRRKVQSTTTQNAVASFFTPTSQKPPEKTIWQERAPDDDSPSTLLVGKYIPTNASSRTGTSSPVRRKVAAFDFDSTLIETSSGKKHSSDAHDWKWWHPTVPGMLKKLYLEEGYKVVVISNQAGITLKNDAKTPKAHRSRLSSFKTKVSSVFNQLDLPISVYAATEKDAYRKPRTGMWTEMLDDYDLSAPGAVDLEASFFVGDAGGRLAGTGTPKDFSCSDRNFAENIGIKFHTPEEYFLKQPVRAFHRTFEPSRHLNQGEGIKIEKFSKRNPLDIVISVGSPGAGKSTFYWKHLQPLGYMRINQDILKTRDKCLKLADEYLSEGKPVAVDNTNADVEVRSTWVALAKKHGIPIRCVLFLTEPEICEHNDAVRALNQPMNPEKRSMLPKQAFTGFSGRYKRPELSEGFQDITEVPFRFSGTGPEREIWSQYWN